MDQFEIGALDFLILSILVLFAGMRVTRAVPLLERNYIPPAVTGGVLFSIAAALLESFGGIALSFDMDLRNLLLLAFFATVGLNAKLRMLAAGGKALAILVACAGLFLILQNATGVGIAVALGAHPGYGLMAGSVSLAGGHGTAIAWGAEAAEAGLASAPKLGIAFATFGLLGGGLLGGPIAGRLLRRMGPQQSEAERSGATDEAGPEAESSPPLLLSLDQRLGTLLLLAMCIEGGNLVNRLLFEQGVVLPGFLTALLMGVVLTNAADLFGFTLNRTAIDLAAELSLAVFLSMSMMSMQLTALAGSLIPIVVVMFAQIVVITVFVVGIVFRLMGRDYDACVISAGFIGLGLGATPVAIANMTAVTNRFGPSAKAFLVVPLVGAFFVDIMNAAVIKLFIRTLARFFG